MILVLLSPPSSIYRRGNGFRKLNKFGVYGWNFPLVCLTTKSPSESENSKDAMEPERGRCADQQRRKDNASESGLAA